MNNDGHDVSARMGYVFHQWINRRQDERRNQRLPWEASLYEWKNMLEEVRRLPIVLKQDRTDTLPTVHQQCSQTEPVAMIENRLLCVLGTDVTKCPILQSLYAHFRDDAVATERLNEQWRAEHAGEGRVMAATTEEDADLAAAQVCTWHIFTSKFVPVNPHRQIDTSEGYLKDESDRLYWQTVYGHLSTDDEVPV